MILTISYVQNRKYYTVFFTLHKECDIGKYGITCSETCGNCRNQTHCQNVDGLCSEGCSAGYKGSLCTERKYNVYLIDCFVYSCMYDIGLFL